MDAQDLLMQIHAVGSTVEGVTILGGEPFDQAVALSELLLGIRGQGLSTMVYSGYTQEELIAAGHVPILSMIDVLVEGRYVQSMRNTGLQWRGSENQRILFLTGRYADYAVSDGQEIEVMVDAHGGLEVYGYPDEWVFRS
jgi:anaerobic ribonucleoside-triphosphate reductase activating protein